MSKLTSIIKKVKGKTTMVKTNELFKVLSDLVVDMGTKLGLKLVDNKISDEDCKDAGIRSGKVLSVAGNKSIKQWETIESVLQKKFEAYMSGIKIGLDSDDN